MTQLSQQAYLLFQEVMEMAPDAAKNQLEIACKGHRDLLEEALGFLADHHNLEAKSFLETPLVDHLVSDWKRQPLAEGQTVGQYHLIRELGQGGMGQVFLAQQLKPVRRKVALKFLKHDLSSHLTRAYFSKERQILAHLEHPFIARIFNADVTDEDVPFFAMEFVDGLPLNVYCRENIPELNARIRLFQKVCKGLIYAHQRGIIHRDLKPGNILVTEKGPEVVPKIIDFGISRVVGDTWDTQMFTHHSLIAGTPLYMSPEQAGLYHAPVDSRSDIYALGIMLYELMVDRHPGTGLGDPEERSGAWPKMAFFKEYPLPSQKLMALYKKTGEPTAKRSAKQVQGDLDWIIHKATAKNPSKRYATVDELYEDLNLFLENKPIFSRPTTTWFRFRKFATRHKFLLGMVGLVTTILLIGMLGLSLGLFRAKKAEHAALKETQRYNYTLNLIEEMLASPDPGLKGREVRAVDILHSFGQRQNWQTQALPEVQATLHFLIGKTLQSLGDWQSSAEHLEKAFVLSQPGSIIDPIQRLEIALHHSQVHLQLNRREDLLTRVSSDLERAKDTLGKNHPMTLRFFQLLGDVYAGMGDYQAAAVTLDAGLDAATTAFADDSQEILSLKYERACVYSRLGQYQKSHDLFEEIAPMLAQTEGRLAVITLHAYQKGALDLIQLNRPSEALEALIAHLPREQSVFGPNHPVPLKSQLGQLIALAMTGQFTQAVTLGESLHKEIIQARGPADKLTQQVLHALGRAYLGNFQHRKALQTYRQALAQQEAHNSESLAANVTRINLASTLFELGELDEAERTAQKALELCQSLLQNNHPYTLGTQRVLAEIYTSKGDFQRAKAIVNSVLELNQASTHALRILVRLALLENETDIAEAHLQTAETLEPRSWETQALRLQISAETSASPELEAPFEAWLLKAEKRGPLHKRLGQPLLNALSEIKNPGIDPHLINRLERLIIDPQVSTVSGKKERHPSPKPNP